MQQQVKFKGNEVQFSFNNGNVILVFSQFDMGNKYKVYKHDGTGYNFIDAQPSITSAFRSAEVTAKTPWQDATKDDIPQLIKRTN